MTIVCAVKNCKSSTGNSETRKISFFKFPMDIPSILEQWITATCKQNWMPRSSSRICELHFKDTDFTNALKVKRLKPDSVPTQNLYYQNFHEDTYQGNTSSLINVDITTDSNSHCHILQPIDEKPNLLRDPPKTHQCERCSKLDDENKQLKGIINSLTEAYEKKLKDLGKTFKICLKEEKKIWQRKFIIQKKKKELLRKQKKRIEKKFCS